jgi:fumarate reductase subunit D
MPERKRIAPWLLAFPAGIAYGLLIPLLAIAWPRGNGESEMAAGFVLAFGVVPLFGIVLLVVLGVAAWRSTHRLRVSGMAVGLALLGFSLVLTILFKI